MLAILIGVNIGPNLTYTGSLATLLWRRVLHAKGQAPSLARFTALGLLTVPGCLLLGTARRSGSAWRCSDQWGSADQWGSGQSVGAVDVARAASTCSSEVSLKSA